MLPTPDFDAATLHWLNDLAPQGILTTDTTLRIRSWNRWLETRTGHLASEVIGRPLLEVYPHLGDRRLDRYYQNALAGQVQVLAQRFHQYLLPLPPSLPDSDLDYMPQTVRIAPLLEAGGVIGTITVIEDVTERMVREAELHAAVRLRDQFVSVAAHELRTPLTALLSAAQLLQRRLRPTEHLDPRNSRTLTVLVQQAVRLNTMIHGLLDLSRIETGQLALDNRPLDLAALTQ
jgi:PAS domain S-box-containing protein